MKRTALILLICAGTLVACNGGDNATSSTDATAFAKWEQLSQAGDLGAARAELEAIRARDGNSPEIAFRLGLTLDRMDDLSKAVRTYKDALKEFPDSARLWVALGNDYYQLKRWEKARDALLKARELGAADKFTAYSLGICYGNLNDPKSSEAEFLRAVDAGFEPNSVKYNLALLRLAENDYREAKRLLEEVLLASPENYEALREFGNVLIKTTDDPETIAEVQRLAWDVVDHQPEDWRAHALLGDAFMAADDYEAAVEAYTRALEYSENLPEVEERYLEAENRRRAQAEQNAKSEVQVEPETFSGDDLSDSEETSR